MIDRFHRLLELLPAHSSLWLESAKARQGLESIIIDQYEIDDCLHYTGQIVIEQVNDNLVATKTWDKGSYPVPEEEIHGWIRLIEEVYQSEQNGA